MIGVEIVNPEGDLDVLGHPPVDAKLAVTVQRECLKRGLIIELGGRQGSVIRLLPPLIINDRQINHVVEILAAALDAAQAKTSAHAAREVAPPVELS